MARVLIIDDSAAHRNALAGWLHKAGHVALEAADAESGVALAHQQKPDLILMDVVMPGQNGFEATRQLQKSPVTRHIGVVIISSKAQPIDLAWGKRQGAVDYLPKPFSESQLIQTVGRVLSKQGK